MRNELQTRIDYAMKAAHMAELRWLAAWERLDLEAAENWARTGQAALQNVARLRAKAAR